MPQVTEAMCPRDSAGRPIISGHADVVMAATKPTLFSNAVSNHLQIPNGLDGIEHRAFRGIIDPFFTAEKLAPLASGLDDLAAELLNSLVQTQDSFDAVSDLGARYSVRAQSLWLGWSPAYEDELLQWVEDNRAATRSGDRSQTAEVAERFDQIINELLDERRDALTPEAPRDVTEELMGVQTADGETLTNEQLVSILRNWTGGDLSSVALCVGVVVHWLATHPAHRDHIIAASDEQLDRIIDEILRLDDPFVSNRRIATRETEVNGCPVHQGEQVVLDWRRANRDSEVITDEASFDPDGHAAANLVYGIGPHVCPGRPLATLELRVLVRALLNVGHVSLDESESPVREEAPVAGYRSLRVRVTQI